MQLTGCTCCSIASVVVVVVSLLDFAIDNFLCTYTRRKIAKEYCQCCGYTAYAQYEKCDCAYALLAMKLHQTVCKHL